MPRFDEPCLTRPAESVCAELGVGPPPQRPLPELVDPDELPKVVTPSTEPLVQIAHPKIQSLQNYQLAGWLVRAVASVTSATAER